MTHSSAAFANQIRFLLQSLNEENADHVFEELREFVDYGIEGSVLLLETCLDYLSRAELKNTQVEAIFASLFKYIFDRPNFCTIFCQSLRSTAISERFLENLSNTLHFSACEKIGIGLALLDSEHLEFRTCGRNFCMAQIEELCANPVPMKSVEQIQNIIMYLHQAEGLYPLLDSFIQMLSLVHLERGASFVLAPLLSDELRKANLLGDLDLFCESRENDFDAILAEMEKERNVDNIMMELGYGCTVNALQCKEILCLFLPLTEATISRLLGTVARTQAGLGDNQNTFVESLSALGSNSLSELPLLSSWNIEILIDSVKQLAPGTNWIGVIEKLDHEGFYVPNYDAFSFLMAAYRHACPDQFPLHAICGSVWKNVQGQLSFLKYAVSAPPEIFTFAHSARQLAYVDAVYGHKFQLGHANHAWLCLDLLSVLCQLAERGHGSSVQSMLEYPLKHYPEILLLGLAHINTAYNVLQYEVSSIAFPLIVGNSMGNGMILHLWHVNPDLVLRGFVDVHIIDPNNMTRILDICKELKILSQVLELIPSPFSIRLAALASRHELVDLEKWLPDNLTTYKDIFFEECLKFLREIQFGAAQVSSSSFHHSGAIMDLYSETSSTFLKVLHAHTGLVTSSQLSEEMERLHVTIMRANPKFQSCGATDSSISDRYAEDIEAESNSYFLQMYSCQLTVDAVVLKLSQFKESSEKREQLIYECMIANLFEECKFFPKYPERQLRIAAVLFGSVISHQLVTHLSLGIALRYVLDAMRKPPDAKMFVFGTKALEQFADRLVEWPQYCNHILQISHLRNTHPDLVAFVEQTLARVSSGHLESDGGNNSDDQHHGSTQLTSVNMEMSASSLQSLGASSIQPGQPSSLPLQHRLQSSLDDRHKASVTLSNSTKPLVAPAGEPLVASSGDATSIDKSLNSINAPATVSSSPGSIRPLRGITSTRFGSAMNIETLVAASERRETPIEAPALEIQDKISFIINNISAANVEAKAKEFTEIFKEQYYPWFAQYMVMKRASIEPNFHDLYLKFLDKVNSKALNKEIVQATYENCRVLLGSELIKSSSEERSLLKNLGSWLGKFTIGRNQVLKAREIDPKSLIIEAYEKGLMIAVIPFTSKILEPCRNSIAYQPPNPWTMGILGLLAEIYVLPNLKMNLKFDIEVLFKNLGVDMKDITPTSLLENRPRQIEGNPDFSNKDIGASHPPMISEVKSAIVSTPNKVELPVEVASPHTGGHTHLLSQYAAPFHLPTGTLMEDEKLVALRLSDQLPSAQGLLQATPSQLPFSVSQPTTLIPNIGTHVIINQKISALGLHLHFQRVAPIAMDRAIKEILSGMVQRSVNIASQTTKELVLKDYAMESDEALIYNAAHAMVSNLAGSLAHVTCKEPLRASLARQLGNLLQGLTISNERLEQAVQLVTNDNLDKACAEMERAAADMAVQTIDKELEIRLSLRRKHREGIGSTFFDGSMYTQGSMAVLPEALRPKPGHLSLSQQQVYEGFVQLPRQNQSNEGSNMLPADSAPPGGAGQSVSHGSALVQLDPTIYSSSPGNSGLMAVSQSLDFVTEDLESTSVQLLSASSTHMGMGDGVIKHISENDSVVASFPSTASASDLSSVEPSDAVKELVTASQSFPSTVASERLGISISEPLVTRDALDKYQIVAEKLETLVTNGASESELQGLVAEVPEIIHRCASRDEAALAVAQKVFKGLYADASNSSNVAAYLAILVAIRDLCKLVVKELTSWVIYSDEERKFNKDIIISLIRSELLNLAEYNVHMAKLVDGGRNKAATEFAFSLLQTLVIEERGVISELPNLVDAMAKIASKPGSPESLQQLIEIVKSPVANMDALSVNSLGKEDKTRQSRDKKAPIHSAATREEHNNGEPVEQDPTGFREQVSKLFVEWYRICELPGTNDAACAHYVLQLHQNGLLKGEHISDRFFHLLMEISFSHCLSSEAIITGPLQSHQQVHSMSFFAIDIFSNLVFSILKYSPVDQGFSKFNLISKILAVTVRFIQKDAEEKKTSFNPRPYFRFFINWLSELGSPDPVFDGANFQVLITFANAFHALQPLKIPAFSFAWLELVSHRSFMPKLLTGNPSKGWPYLHRLLVDLFQFMEPFLRNAILGEPVHFLYRGTLRVLLMLLHDFPEFLCGYHFTFCDVIPPSCIQMRNIILSAFPRNMRLPDPSTPNLKIDLLVEINQSPLILSDVDASLKVKQMKTDVDEYLKMGQQGSSFLSGMKQRLLLLPIDAARAGTRYNIPLINSLVLYVGMQAMQQLKARTPPHVQPMASSPLAGFLVSAALDIFQTLLAELDTEGRYLFLNAVANQLRYPNTHTHYFSFILLYLFAESNQEIIPEQITRVLLERLIVSRPHPWGLLITFIELIKNPRYNFWNRTFISCAPEIEKLFESVSRSCGGANPLDESTVSGGFSENMH
ncbi:hypothetical protein VitviT2T_023400 [Vitis vinifera]|uniref:CCR4-NOT transcription complex subunit 1 n=1 Tax=Vitis vinifera TaxID=29760 RepID=A0ABY9DEN4_VITVI|nr:uncharacterized protein LOC100261590 [Vitis vinifera]WKA05432.1 hypothetical protein VitviT2T_023400 [Vitis vinifera]|eukprot:XP_010661326.1 PREDICTED: CCR4-NOT transcription complex subunit 1 [Vitis vinifera]